jgi:hypothetical protein
MNKFEPNCANCNSQFLSTDRNRFGFNSVCPKRGFTVIEALNGLVGFGFGQIRFSSVGENEKTRAICVKCAQDLGGSYAKLLEFRARSVDCYIKNTLSCEPPLNDNDENYRTPKRLKIAPPKTPLKCKVKKYYATSRTRTTFGNTVKGLIKYEMKELVKYTSFKASKLTRENWLPSNDTVRKELIQHAPLTSKILEGLLCKTRNPKNTSHFHNLVRSVLGIALRARNQRANLYQKAISLALFMGKASSEVCVSRLIFN